MSQIRKLQGGGSTRWGTLTINGIKYDLNDEATRNAFIEHLTPTSGEYGDYYNDVLEKLRGGLDLAGDSISNRMSGINAFSGNTNKENRLLNTHETERQKRRDARKNNGVHRGKEAIANILAFKMPTPEIEPDIQEINNKVRVFDYNPEGEFAKTPGNDALRNRMRYYYDYISDKDMWKKAYKWSEALDPTVESDLQLWYEGLGEDYLSRRNEMERIVEEAIEKARVAKNWNSVDPVTKKILSYFNIGVPSNSTINNGSETDNKPYVDNNGNIIKNSKNEKGQWGTYYDDNGRLHTTFDAGTIPYLINADRFNLFENLDDSYKDSIIYNGVFYKPDEIAENVDLQNIMNEVEYLNNSATSPADAYEKIKDKLNYTDYGDRLGNIALYDATKHYISNANIRKYLNDYGINNAAILNATNAYDVPEGTNIYEIYDYSHNGDGRYGFRNPFYLIVDSEGQLHLTEADENGKQHRRWNSVPEEYAFLNKAYGTVSGIYNKHQYEGKYYGRFIRKDESGDEYHFAEDDDGNIYHLDKNGKPTLLTKEFGKRILNGDTFTPKELDESKKQAKRESKAAKRSDGGNLEYQKDGGKIKALPQKFQPGGMLWETPTEISDLGKINDPSAQGANGYYVGNFLQFGDTKWKDLRPQDKNDLRAAGLDVLSAISALVPEYGTIPAAVLGLTSTGLLTTSDIQNKLPVGKVIKNAGINLGLDAVSLLPFGMGEGAAVAKIGKNISKVGHILIPALNTAGLYVARDAAAKVIKGEKLSTDDYRALAAGITSILNIGHGATRRISDASLVRSTNKARANVGNKPSVETPVHEREVILSKDASKNAGKKTSVKLKDGEVNAVINAKPEEAAKTLRNTLEKTHKVAKTELPSDDAKLLKDWGFEVDVNHKNLRVTKKARQTEGSIKKVSESTPSQSTPEKKSSYVKSLYHTSMYRDEVIKDAMQDKAVRSELDKLRENGEWGFMRENAYKRAQKRIGETPVNFFGGRKRTAAANEEQPKQQESVTKGSENAPETKPKENNTKNTTNSEAPKEVATTPTPESTPKEVKTSESTVKPEATIEVEPGSTKSTSGRTYKQISMDKRASNLRKLQKSTNPLKTLSDLERSNGDKLFTNEEELDAVVNAIIKSTSYRGGKKTASAYQDKLLNKLSALEKAGRLYEKGGVLKAQNGLTNMPDYTKINTSKGLNYKFTPWGTITNNYGVIENASKFNITTPSWNPQYSRPDVSLFPNGYDYTKISNNSTNNSDTDYGFGGSKSTEIPESKRGINDFWLGVAELGNTISANNKMYNTLLRVGPPPTRGDSPAAPYVPTYLTAHQHAQANLNNQLMNKVQAVSSNLTPYYAAKLAQNSQLNAAQRDLTAQMANVEQQSNLTNAQANYQKELTDYNNSYEDALRLYSYKEAVAQLEAAKQASNFESVKAFGRENRYKLDQDRRQLGTMRATEYANAAQKTYDEMLQGEYPTEYAKWLTIDQTPYSSFEEYLEKVYPNKYNLKRNYWKNERNKMLAAIASNTAKQRLNFPMLAKKGGRVNGSTRYTLEPDERIWIENVKAAHKQIAKLNDNAIKLLLRALK